MKFSACTEWLLISSNEHIADGDKDLEAKLHQDAISNAPVDTGALRATSACALAVATCIEFAHLAKHGALLFSKRPF